MLLALLLAVAAPPASPASLAPPSAIDAERAFAADAQESGQWAAFRKWSTADAVMFVPEPVRAHDFLEGRKEPPVAVYWWPGKSFVSCDGRTAINSGPWVREFGRSVGYFTTVWKRQADGGWKWVYDAGDALATMRAEGGDIEARRAACPTLPVPPVPQREMPAGVKYGSGSSADGTLNWNWTVLPDGSRTFSALLWDGRDHRPVIADRVAAPAK